MSFLPPGRDEAQHGPGSSPDGAAHRDRALAFAAVVAVVFALALTVYVNERLRFGPRGDPAPPAPLRIDVNRADAATLQLLPGIGPAMAGRIIAGRTRGGPFTDPKDLQNRVKGIGPKTAHRITPYVTFGNAAAR